MIADTHSTAIPAGPAQSGAAARLVRSLDGLDQLAAAWDALAGGAGSPMQQFIWARAYVESYCRRGDQLHVVTVGPGGAADGNRATHPAEGPGPAGNARRPRDV
jgi:hypothetical protein